MDEVAREKARMALEDAVYRMIEAGFTESEITEEVRYAIETAEDA